MSEITHEASEEFVRKVKELLEAITRQPYSITNKQYLEKSVWEIYLDKIKVGGNNGIFWIGEDENSIIKLCSWRFYDVNDVIAEEYGLNLRVGDELLKNKNWEKYKKRVPGLIAELEAAERIADEVNEKYSTNIKLWTLHKPYYETYFNSKGINDDEKLQEIERHARAMYETWKLWDEWATKVGREIYEKTTKKRIRRDEFIEEVLSWLRDITRAVYLVGKKKPGVPWTIIGNPRDKNNITANRGVWFVKETRDSIIMTSDNLKTINARSLEEYKQIHQRNKGKIALKKAEDSFRDTIVNPDLLQNITEQVGKEFQVRIHVKRERPVMITAFHASKLRPYGKLYEIEKHAKALAEAWNKIKDIMLKQEEGKDPRSNR